MKKIRRILWEKGPFKFLVNFSCVTRLSPSLRPILLNHAKISCVVIDTNSIENEENLSDIIGKGIISNID